MDKVKIENRKKAIIELINAATEGEKLKKLIYDRLNDETIYYSEKDGSIADWETGDERVTSYIEEKDDDFKKLMDDTFSIISKIQSTEGITLEEVAEQITKSGNPINKYDLILRYCKKTEYDRESEDTIYDEDVVDFFPEIDGYADDEKPRQAALYMLKNGISIDQIPEKLLFDLNFVDDYISQCSLANAREQEIKNITPQNALKNALSDGIQPEEIANIPDKNTQEIGVQTHDKQ